MRITLKAFTTIAVLVMAGSLLAAQESREVKKTVPLPKDGSVSIDTYKGSINVETWDKAEVDIVAKIEADSWGGRYEEDKVRDTEIVIDPSTDAVRIKTDYRKLDRRHSSFWDIFEGENGSYPFVHYHIKMPSTARLSIKDYKSEITVDNLRAELDVNTYKGSTDIRALEGGIDLETYKGDCRVEFARFSAQSSFETYKGDIRISVPARSSFSLDADVGRRGDFDSDFDYRTSARSSRNKENWYRGDMNGGGPSLKIRTDKGSFRLTKR